MCPNVFYTWKYDVLCLNLCYIRKWVMSEPMLDTKIWLSDIMLHTKCVMFEHMFHTNMRFGVSELMLHTKMSNVGTYVTQKYEMCSVRTYVPYENVICLNLCYTRKYDVLFPNLCVIRECFNPISVSLFRTLDLDIASTDVRWHLAIPLNTNVYTKFYQNIPKGSRCRAIFTFFQNLYLEKASTNDKWHLTISWARSGQYQFVCKIASQYPTQFKK